MDLFITILLIVVVGFSAILHEVAHGLAARALGDKTAEYAGRLTLNPLKHLDWFGSVIMPFFLSLAHLPLFAYAKPVPYNPYNLSNQKLGPALVSAAGPGTNLLIAIIMAGLIRTNLLPLGIQSFLFLVLEVNVSLGIFNLLPIPPLDGSKLLYAFLPRRFDHIKYTLERYGIFIVFIFIYYFSWILLPILNFVERILIGS